MRPFFLLCCQYVFFKIQFDADNLQKIIFKNTCTCNFCTYICQNFYDMKQEKATLPELLGIENETELINKCLELYAIEESISTILNKLICSELTTKELVFCAFISGKLQGESNEEKMRMFTNYAIQQIQKKNNS